MLEISQTLGTFLMLGTALVVGAATFSNLVNVYGDLNMHTANIQQVGTVFSANLKNTGTLSNLTLSNVGTADFTGTTNLRATTNLIGANLNANSNNILNVGYTNIDTASISSLQANSIVANTMTISNINDITVNVSSGFYNRLYTSSLQMTGGFIASTSLALLSTGQYDFSKSITLISTSFSTISSFQNNILSYSYNAIVNDETSFNIGAGYTVTGNNVSQWASTCLIGNSVQVQPMSVEIDNDPTSAWTGTGTFDVQRTLNNGNPPYDIYVAYTLGTSPLIININDYNLYRFTKSGTGVGGWSYVAESRTVSDK
jgi:hypothetical protein